MRQNFKNLISDTAVFALGSGLTKLIQFFLLPMYTALLTTGQYGTGELVNNLSELLYPLCCLGIYEGVFRFALDRDADKSQVFAVGLRTMLAELPLVAAIAVAGYALTGFDYTLPLAVLCILTSARKTCMNFAKGLGYTRLYAGSGVIGTLVLGIAGYCLIGPAGMGVTGYLLALVASQATQLLVVFLGARLWRYVTARKPSAPMVRAMLRYSLPLIPNALAWWFVNISGRYIVLFAVDASAAGLYTAASKLPAILNMIVLVFQQAWQIFSAREYEGDDREESYGAVFAAFSPMLLCATSLLIAIADPLAQLMLNGTFIEAKGLVPLLMAGAAVNGYSSFFGTIYNAAKRNLMLLVTALIGAAVNLAVGIALVGIVGIWGPAFGALAAYAVIALSRAMDTRRFAKIPVDAALLASGFAVIALQIVLHAVDFPHVTATCLAASATLIAFSLFRNRPALKRFSTSFKLRK